MNHIQTKHKDSRLLRFCVALGVLIVATMVSGCFENYGRLKHNDEVTRAFQTYQVEPDYKYYYYGRTNMPYAIVGIDRAYYMQSTVWREVDRDTEQFKKMIFWVWDDVYVPFYPQWRSYYGSRRQKGRYLVFGHLVCRDPIRGR